jgi:hypothetical protein
MMMKRNRQKDLRRDIQRDKKQNKKWERGREGEREMYQQRLALNGRKRKRKTGSQAVIQTNTKKIERNKEASERRRSEATP